ncbi:glycosyltransferase family 2 protein [Sphingomonas sp. Leaf37]|uniref:glycosyltransferase family 2 protein n=1 Tax=Sphingomonas sp. Leaf37 TaxID=2876552 RepID=UPI001E2D5B19|nr:glycosyltransferase family 2 protein [Sphingomonas sp. Leaf37]
MTHTPTIAATLIVRDEARCILRCLDSVAPFVDRMVVVDTGSVDDTVAIALGAGAEVHHVPWSDDFSSARNEALRLAASDWHLVLDADEWIVSGGDSLRDWCREPARLGQACIHSDDGDGATTTRSWITRLLPRGVWFEGRVHEQVASALPRVRTGLHVGHDGYRLAQIARKQDRNHRLLLAELAAQPGDPYLLYQLGKDADMRGDALESARHYADAVPVTPRSAAWRHALITCAIPALVKAGRLEQAMALAEAEMPYWTGSPDFFFVLGDLLLARAIADPARAVDQWLPLAVGAWERCLAIGEQPALEGSVAGRGSRLARHNLHVIGLQLALLAG